MDEAVRAALTRGEVIDITTTGRQTGEARRIEIVYHVIDDRLFISGMPRAGARRAWIANLDADPRLTFHLKGRVVADLPAHARIVDDPAERRAVLTQVAANWNRTDLDEMVAHSPLIEVTIDEDASDAADA